MSNKITDLLNRQGFGSEDKVLETKPEGIGVSSGKAISVTLDDIDFYALNPRKAENPEYETIKESIREVHLEQPLTLTKRPGDAGYTLYNGGNTRLKALKELWQETGDDKFFYLDCRFMPWPAHGDLDILMKHMIENETRADMLLVDKANAVFKIKQLHEKETGKKIGLRPLEELLKTKGWKVSFSLLGSFIFVADKLANRIPLALSEGLGKRKVIEIRKIYNAIEKYITAKLPELDAAQMQELYLDSLATYDSEESLGDDYALQDTCRLIGEQVNIDGPRVHLEIDHIIRHGAIYDKGSTSSKFNDKGQRVTGSNNENTDTGGEVEGVRPITGSEQNKTTTGSVSKEAQRKAQIIEMGFQARNKVKSILIKYECLNKYLHEEESYPFFSSSDAEMLMLRVDFDENNELWDNQQIAVMREFVPFMSAYFAARIEQSDIPENIKLLDKNALETCSQTLRGQFAAVERDIDMLRYGFSYDPDEISLVMEVHNEFAELGRLLRVYRTNVEEEDNA